MATTMYDIMHPGAAEERDAGFPYAPQGWTRRTAEAAAERDSLVLSEDHWEAIRVLQGCYTDEPAPRVRLLHDALEARFQDKGGAKFLFELFPEGPISQGCRLAGLHPPSGSTDDSSGTVQ